MESKLRGSNGDYGFVAAWHGHRLPLLGFAIFTFLVVAFKALWARRSHFQKTTKSSLLATQTSTPVKSDESSWLELKTDSKIADGIKPPTVSTERKKLENVKKHESRAPKSWPPPKRVIGSRIGKVAGIPGPITAEQLDQTLKYAKHFVADLTESLTRKYPTSILETQLHDLSYIDYDDFFITPPKISQEARNTKCFYMLILPTYNIDTVLNNYLAHLQETHHDFRIDTAPLSDLLGYSVFGFGDREGWPTEEEGFCSQAKEVDKWMAKLTGRKRAYPLGMGDVKADAQHRLEEWRIGIEEVIASIFVTGGLGEGVTGSGDAVESDEEDGEIENETVFLPSNQTAPIKPQPSTTTASSTPLKAMVPTTSPTHAALTKQGYTIIGTHSGVKICRWTKSALRGRGSCYKHSFYGIASHTCMETTPSLSCSNKCVFCWRHGTNPVGTTWRWAVDPPEMILSGAITAHYQKIKSLRGVPGVRAERFIEAMRIRHCALSLVGEPIFYPHINEFVSLLHKQRISSFLVCNAQHPDQLAALQPVTQLYVSIDASNRDSLRKIDRPLHRDFWERFLRCLDILREKRFSMRTVFRLTLVKGFNIDDEVEGYADLVGRGLPCFVEIKGVTYCGTSSSSSAGLTMQNVPFYTEVVAFVAALDKALAARGLEYGIAAEHAHSCCVLLASNRFWVEGKWHTLIDYEGFFKCLERGRDFRPEDYMGAETPEWATWGRGGFDPRDERVDRKGRPIERLEEVREEVVKEGGPGER